MPAEWAQSSNCSPREPNLGRQSREGFFVQPETMTTSRLLGRPMPVSFAASSLQHSEQTSYFIPSISLGRHRRAPPAQGAGRWAHFLPFFDLTGLEWVIILVTFRSF